ncbi:MAG: GPW/gp25 family protein [Myxococcales bacterium]|nr:GPW/gp25 family protein [Myxococcales bacterium]
MIPTHSVPFGFAFPFRVDPGSGAIATSAGDENLRENLHFLLQTELNERVLRREHGAGLRGLLHQPMNDAFLQLAQHQISRAIVQHEQRVQLVELRVRVGDEPGVLEIDVIYTVRRTQQTDAMRLLFPTAG